MRVLLVERSHVEGQPDTMPKDPPISKYGI